MNPSFRMPFSKLPSIESNLYLVINIIKMLYETFAAFMFYCYSYTVCRQIHMLAVFFLAGSDPVCKSCSIE